MQAKKLLNLIGRIVFDKKGFNILALQMPPSASLCDYIIIAEGFVGRHLQALASHVEEELKKQKILPVKIEAGEQWVILDYGQIMLHLFVPEARHLYRLENIWEQTKEIPLKLET